MIGLALPTRNLIFKLDKVTLSSRKLLLHQLLDNFDLWRKKANHKILVLLHACNCGWSTYIFREPTNKDLFIYFMKEIYLDLILKIRKMKFLGKRSIIEIVLNFVIRFIFMICLDGLDLGI